MGEERWIERFERELSRISTVKPPAWPDSESYLAGCGAAVRDVIDALGVHRDPQAAIAAVARRPARPGSGHNESVWRAGHTDALRLLAGRVRNGDRRPIDWIAMR